MKRKAEEYAEFVVTVGSEKHIYIHFGKTTMVYDVDGFYWFQLEGKLTGVEVRRAIAVFNIGYTKGIFDGEERLRARLKELLHI